MTQACETSSGNCGSDLARGQKLLLLWGLPLLVAVLGWFTGPWRWTVWAVTLLWMGVACSINAKGCGRVHCAFTGPLYIVLGLVAAACAAGWICPSPVWFWVVAIGGTIAAFVPEWRGKVYWKANE